MSLRVQSELELLLRGQGEAWTRELLLGAIKCDHGYTTSSAAVQHFVDVLAEMSTEQQRALLRFVTGSPRLPPGGVAALRPQLTIVMKCSSGGAQLTPAFKTQAVAAGGRFWLLFSWAR